MTCVICSEARRCVAAVALMVSAMLGSACASAPPVVQLLPALDAQQLALQLEQREALQHPTRVVFDWAMTEQGVRASGQGVARLEPAFKARLDLFLGNGEGAGRAALVDDELRLPLDLPPAVVPPANLLWGVLGVFRPGLGTVLLGAARQTDGLTLRYALANGDEVQYHLVEGRLDRIEVLQSGSVVQQVVLQRDALGVPLEARFRDLVAVRELRLTRTDVQRTEPFPSDIWFP